ncbi:unnamed protein product [Gongylonema pulchrum]|uniref:Nucleoprotein TPR n=1 Tax=Gongylonema pulchrum TaxID=637853 RepID=A0A183E4P0_9BILA|nr:unnamed protein product [Gongylonema pulchrum]
MVQQKLALQKELHCFQEQMNDLNILKAKADSRVSEIEANCAKILAEKTACKDDGICFQAVLRVENDRLEEELRTANALVEEQKQKLELVGENLVKVSERVAFLERCMANTSTSSEEYLGPGGTSRSATALFEVIKYLQGENRQTAERMMNAELQWKRLQSQQADATEQRLKLEEEILKLQKEAEAYVREIAKKNEMVSRLAATEGLQKENQSLKVQTERLTSRCEQLSKAAHVREITKKNEMVSRLAATEGLQKENQSLKVQTERLTNRCEQLSKAASDLQARFATLEAEKIAEKGKLQSALSDLQIARKEIETWKEKHNQALISSNFTRKMIFSNEIEAVKRKLSILTAERDSTRKELEKSVREAPSKAALADLQKKLEDSETERLKQSTKFEQLRQIARQYKHKSQTLEKELETAQAQKDEKSAADDSAAEIARLKQELVAAHAEIEKQKQQKTLPRTGWPTEAMTGTTQSKTAPLLHTQLKQVEELNLQNKDLSNKVEELTKKCGDLEGKLSESEMKLVELKQENDTKGNSN